MKKVWYFLILLICLTQAVYAADDFTNKEIRSIKDIVHSFISFQREVRKYGPSMIGQVDINCDAKELESTINYALNKHDFDSYKNQRLVDHAEDLHDFSFLKEEDFVTVIFLENYTEVYHLISGEMMTTSGVDRRNKVKLQKVGEEWRIIEHKIYDLGSLRPRGELKFGRSTNISIANSLLLWDRKNFFISESFLRELRPTNKMAVEEITIHPVEEAYSYDQVEESGYGSVASSPWYWNGIAAVNYSDAYAKTYNSSYRIYSEDCTNFASQCLKAGGKPYRDGPRTDYSSWYYGWLTWFTSYTWAGAHNLVMHMYNYTNSNLFPTSIYELAKGDLIFADWDRDTIGDHSMIIRLVLYNEVDGYVNYHTPNTFNRRISDIIADHPNALYLICVVGDAYTN